MPEQAMLLAAGFGTRMRPLTEACPKPLLPLAGRSLLDHALDRLAAAGIARVVVNAHYQAGALEAHLASRKGPPVTVLLHEAELRDTGGAVAAAYAAGALAPAPAFVINGDSFWMDGPAGTLTRLAEAFDPAREDALLLVHRVALIQSGSGLGDFLLDPWGKVSRPESSRLAPYVYAGVQLLAPALLDGAADACFGMNAAWDRAIAAGRLRALVHDGLWFHLSRPPDLEEAEAALAGGGTGPNT